ncbi:hypothetical protein CJ030_MR5G010213 [Morella rubra]|uniref:Uncharacterized protein n=1 Tax=Morella rubra TaxID=262757 RepID=A0A6A1VJM7_9ROSI|nr:hypothetical protein CJ030_MR5G010213 [Morella rubra]
MPRTKHAAMVGNERARSSRSSAIIRKDFQKYLVPKHQGSDEDEDVDEDVAEAEDEPEGEEVDAEAMEFDIDADLADDPPIIPSPTRVPTLPLPLIPNSLLLRRG